MSAFTPADQAFVRQQYAHIEQLNEQLHTAATPSQPAMLGLWRTGGLLLAFGGLLFWLAAQKRRRYFVAMSVLALTAALYGFRSNIARAMLATDPAFIDSAFAPFKPAVHTFWDDNYFYVESKGIPDHEMMTGITKWQQQVPIPQCYLGNNAWPIPLNPVLATTPVPVNPQHFIRGAVAIAANGVAIFNPYTNTGVDALVDGQLDNFGGHCGRADDYHYHVAPLHLDAQAPDILPIAFALDGFAVYGSLEPDGSAMSPLDDNHGHYGTDGVYHYHGTVAAPYMIGKMVGKVTEDTTLQIVPQAHANPVRPAQTPLQGATITGCQPNGSNNGYVLTYTKGGQTYSVDYNWTPTGQYTFHFITPTGTTTQNYNGFVQCEVPTATTDPASIEDAVLVCPNPATGRIALKINAQAEAQDVLGISLFNLNGTLAYQAAGLPSEISVKDLPKGAYLLVIQFSAGRQVEKLIVQ